MEGNFIILPKLKAMKSIYFLVFWFFFLSACGPKITTRVSAPNSPLNYQEEVIVYDLNQDIPESAVPLGTIKAGDTGFTTQNDYSKIIERLKEEARKNGANLIKINKHKNPDFWSSSHRIEATFYRCDSPLPPVDSATANNLLPDGSDFALLHFYRLLGVGAGVKYDVFLGDSLICRTRANWKKTIKITSTGLNTIWAKTESKTELPIKIEKGKEYYIRCGLEMGILIGRPSLNLITPSSGASEFKAVNYPKRSKK